MPVFDHESRAPIQQQQQQQPPSMNSNSNGNGMQSRHQYSHSGSTNSSGGGQPQPNGFRYNNNGPPPHPALVQAPNSDYSPRSIPNGIPPNDDRMNPYQNGSHNGIGSGPSNLQQQQPSTSSSAPPTKTRRPRPDTDEIRRTGRTHYQELLGFLKSHLAKSEYL